MLIQYNAIHSTVTKYNFIRHIVNNHHQNQETMRTSSNTQRKRKNGSVKSNGQIWNSKRRYN